HQRDLGFGFVFIGVRHERGVIEEIAQRFASLFGFGRGVDQFFQVEQPPFGLFGVFVLERPFVAGVDYRRLDDFRDRVGRVARSFRKAVDDVAEGFQSRYGARLEQVLFDDDVDRLPMRDAEIFGAALDVVERGLADAARGCVDHSHERDRVVRIRREFQLSDYVLDLAAFVQTEAATQGVRHAGGQAGFLEQSRLRVRSIEHGRADSRFTAQVLLDLARDPAGLGLAVEYLRVTDFLALGGGRSKNFIEALS